MSSTVVAPIYIPTNRAFVTVVQLLSRVWFCDPMDCSTPSFPVLHCLLEFAQIHVLWVGDAIRPSHPLPPPSLPSVFPSIRVMCLAFSVGLWGWSTCIYFSFQSLRKQSAFSTTLGKFSQLQAVPLNILVCTQHTLNFALFSKLVNAFSQTNLTSDYLCWKNSKSLILCKYGKTIIFPYPMVGSKSKSDGQESQLLI